MLTMRKDETIETAENKVPALEEEFSFEIEELDSQHAMMMIVPMDPPSSLNHQSRP